MNILLFISTLIFSVLIIRIGAIMFHLTGLEWSIAKFQSLSCFSLTGFTTKEAELITSDRRRRKIATVLIVVGNAGFVALIATFANSIRPSEVAAKSPRYLPDFISINYLPLIHLLIIGVAVYAIYKLFTNTKIARKFTDTIRNQIVKKDLVGPVSFEELLIATGGYGVSQVEIFDMSPALGKSLRDSGFRELDITVLAIESKGKMVPNPPADMKILKGDRLICFGKLIQIREKLCVSK